MKLFFISSAAATVYLMYVKFKATYDGNHDTFRLDFNSTKIKLTINNLDHEVNNIFDSIYINDETNSLL